MLIYILQDNAQEGGEIKGVYTDLDSAKNLWAYLVRKNTANRELYLIHWDMVSNVEVDFTPYWEVSEGDDHV